MIQTAAQITQLLFDASRKEGIAQKAFAASETRSDMDRTRQDWHNMLARVAGHVERLRILQEGS